MASRGAARGKGRAAAVMEWEGGSAGERAGEHSRPGIEHGGRQRRSEAPRARHGSERTRAQVPARARRAESQRGREERGRGWREKEFVNALT